MRKYYVLIAKLWLLLHPRKKQKGIQILSADAIIKERDDEKLKKLEQKKYKSLEHKRPEENDDIQLVEPDSSPIVLLLPALALGATAAATTVYSTTEHKAENLEESNLEGFVTPFAGNHAITSRPGHRKAPVKGASTNHTGYDVSMPVGTALYAVHEGTIEYAGPAGGAGNLIVLRLPNGKVVQYMHLSSIAVKRGQEVKAGQYIGASGNTGVSTGPHLHIEMRDDWNGKGKGSTYNIEPMLTKKAGRNILKQKETQEVVVTKKQERKTTTSTGSRYNRK